MTEIQHKNLAAGRWFELSLCEQLGNVGSEVGRGAKWQRQGRLEQRDRALVRALELLDLTLADNRWAGVRRGEMTRAREVLVDTFYGDKIYHDTPENLEKYFFQFALAARKNV